MIMSDPSGRLRMCHTPLASWIADLPEQRVLSCVLANQSPFTTATLDDFGDHHSFPSRTRDHTLNLIAIACSITDPSLVPAFARTCYNYGLNGVHQPFWMNWGRANPPDFLTPDALHAFHKFFFDHPLKWVINIMGGEELDRRMAALQPRLGVRHWKKGVSTLRQCTGREHRDIQKILVAVIANVVPDRVLCAVRALVKFIFHAQGLLLYDQHLHALDEALREFHSFKNAIVNAGVIKGGMAQSCTSKSRSSKVSFVLFRMHAGWALPISILLTSPNDVTSHMSSHLTVIQVIKTFMSSAAGLWIVWKNCAYLIFMSHSSPTIPAS